MASRMCSVNVQKDPRGLQLHSPLPFLLDLFFGISKLGPSYVSTRSKSRSRTTILTPRKPLWMQGVLVNNDGTRINAPSPLWCARASETGLFHWHTTTPRIFALLLYTPRKDSQLITCTTAQQRYRARVFITFQHDLGRNSHVSRQIRFSMQIALCVVQQQFGFADWPVEGAVNCALAG